MGTVNWIGPQIHCSKPGVAKLALCMSCIS